MGILRKPHVRVTKTVVFAPKSKRLEVEEETRTSDGPRPATMVVELLIQKINKDRKINAGTIKQILGDVNRQQVLERLECLYETIEANGRACIMPSTMRIGKQFMPAIAFFAKQIRKLA